MNAEEAEFIAHRRVDLSFQFNNIPMSARYKLDICMSCHVLSINSLEPLDPCPRCCYQKHYFGIIFMLSGPLSFLRSHYLQLRRSDKSEYPIIRALKAIMRGSALRAGKTAIVHVTHICVAVELG